VSFRIINNERSLFWADSCENELPWSGNSFTKFASGREGLVSLIKSLNFKSDEIVMLPEFLPEGIIAPFRVENIKIIFYALDNLFNPNWEDLHCLLKKHKAKLCVMIHYFGLKKDINKFSELCHSFNSMVLEDLAHLQCNRLSLSESRSDFKLYSLRKIIGVPDGAILQHSYNKKYLKLNFFSLDIRRLIYIVMNIGHLLITTISRYFFSFKFWNGFWKYFSYFFSSYKFLMFYFKRPTSISFISEILLNNFPWNRSIQIRSKFENLYSLKLDKDVFSHLTIPSNDYCSMGFLVSVENRESLNAHLKEHGIQGIWFYHKWVNQKSDCNSMESKDLINNHFLFPTIYSLSTESIERVINIANQWADTQKFNKKLN
jgi:hypothetical protein